MIASDDDARAYKKHLEGLGLRGTAFLTACDFSAHGFEANVAWVARAIELAELLGMPAVRIDSAMAQERELDFETRVHIFAKGLGGALERTSGSPVALGIEILGLRQPLKLPAFQRKLKVWIYRDSFYEVLPGLWQEYFPGIVFAYRDAEPDPHIECPVHLLVCNVSEFLYLLE